MAEPEPVPRAGFGLGPSDFRAKSRTSCAEIAEMLAHGAFLLVCRPVGWIMLRGEFGAAERRSYLENPRVPSWLEH